MKTKLFSKILGVGLALGLVFALGAAVIPAGEAQADEMEWGEVNTPSWEDLVILPASDILDYAVGEDEGDVIYAVLELDGSCTEVGYMLWAAGDVIPNLPAAVLTFYDVAPGLATSDIWSPWAVVMSDDGGVTWSDITENIVDASSLPFEAWEIASLNLVASPPDNEDWVAVAGYTIDTTGYSAPNPNHFIGAPVVPFVVASDDGGDNFTYAHSVVDGGENMLTIADMAISSEVDGIYNIALAGTATVSGVNVMSAPGPYIPVAPVAGAPAAAGAVFRLEAGTWLTGGWVDTRCYDGWDGATEDPCEVLTPTWEILSTGVVAVDFSPNFDMDDTIVCMSVGGPVGDTTFYYHYPYLQEGTFDGGGAWNGEAGFGSAPVQITDEGTDLITFYARYMMGFALPADFDGQDGSANNVYLYVNALNTTSGEAGGFVFISEDCDDLSMRCGPSGNPLLASIDVYGDADTCKAVVGTLGVDVEITGDFPDFDTFNVSTPEPCEGVAVYHTVELDDCCPEWECACKDPSGPGIAVVMYTPDGEKVFATTTGSQTFLYDSFDAVGVLMPLSTGVWGFKGWTNGYGVGNPLDESAFSVSLDDAVSFNQIGLIDTDIDRLSDMAVCPDCDTIYLATISEAVVAAPGDSQEPPVVLPNGSYPCCLLDLPGQIPAVTPGEPLVPSGECLGWFNCDSVWRSYDTGDTWERINHGDWVDLIESEQDEEQILLRLPCDDLEDCCTVYMGIRNTEDLYYSRDCGQCWNKAVNQKLTIQDFAVESENIVYLLDDDGYVSTSTQYGRRPSDPVDTEVGSGHSITSCCEQGWVLVGGHGDEPVGYSADGGETWELTDDLPGDRGTVHVSCDTACSTDSIIYATTDDFASQGGGIYRTNLDEGDWDDLNALDIPYSGIAIGRSDGTLYASSYFIPIDSSECLCDRFVNYNDSYDESYSGVARNLTPCETDCCGTDIWDYLIAGLTAQSFPAIGEWFDIEPSSLRICGCTSIDTNSVLWAIDSWWYDVTDGSDGTLWSYEDCAAKKGPVLTSPADEAIVACDACATCDGAPLTFKWERMCLACSYDIEIMDEDGNTIVTIDELEITGSPPELYWDGLVKADTDGCTTGDQKPLSCGSTYTWHVREANTETDECVHSPWSETWSFTIEASSANAVQLIAPEVGAMGVSLSGVGFSWTSVPEATSYSFVLSANADLSSALATSDQSGTAYAYSGTLDYEVAYYWQVTAWKDGIMLSQSDIGTFSTAPEEIIIEPPPPGEPAVINIPPTQQITPTFIYAIIGIGAALAAVVIVLIVRSRGNKP